MDIELLFAALFLYDLFGVSQEFRCLRTASDLLRCTGGIISILLSVSRRGKGELKSEVFSLPMSGAFFVSFEAGQKKLGTAVPKLLRYIK